MAKTSDKDNNKVEHNPRWKGYVFIIVTSLVALSSISNIPKEVKRSHWAVTVGIASTTFSVSLLILIIDRCQCFKNKCTFQNLYNGKLEGSMLLLFVLFWIVGVAILTRPGGLAYHATNIYFSSWLALASCLYTLDRWSSSKDILSIQELTQLSATLKSWYCLFFTSLICFGSSISMNVYFSGREKIRTGETAFSIALSLFTLLVSLFFILVHYQFFTDCCSHVKQGGWLELSMAFLMILCWLVGVAVLTQTDGIASTMGGTGCGTSGDTDMNVYAVDSCTVFVENTADDGSITKISEACSTFLENDIPGSNLYFFSWFSLVASVTIALRWKAAQALQFAQTAQGRATGGTNMAEVGSADDSDAEFEDAVEDDEDAI